MPFVFLLVFGLICLQARWPAPLVEMDPVETAVVFVAGLGVFVLAAFFATSSNQATCHFSLSPDALAETMVIATVRTTPIMHDLYMDDVLRCHNSLFL